MGVKIKRSQYSLPSHARTRVKVFIVPIPSFDEGLNRGFDHLIQRVKTEREPFLKAKIQTATTNPAYPNAALEMDPASTRFDKLRETSV